MEKPSAPLEKPLEEKTEENPITHHDKLSEADSPKSTFNCLSTGLLTFVLCCIIFAGFGLISYYHSFELANKYPKLYSALGIIPADRLAINQVTLSKGRYQNKEVLDIETKITNNSEQSVTIPWFKIVYLDANFNEIDHYFARPSNPFSSDKIAANDTVIVSHQLPLHQFDDGQMLLIQIGNKTELSLSKYGKILHVANAKE